MNVVRIKTIIVYALKILFWAAWTYPLLRIWLFIPFALMENDLTFMQSHGFRNFMRDFHGGLAVTSLVTSYAFMVFLVLSAVAYLFYHYKTKTRISWPVRILLPLMLLLNFATIELQVVVEKLRMQELQAAPVPGEPIEPSASQLFLRNQE